MHEDHNRVRNLVPHPFDDIQHPFHARLARRAFAPGVIRVPELVRIHRR